MKLEIYTTIEADDPYQVESRLMDIFKMHDWHLRREWFDLPKRVLRQLENNDYLTVKQCDEIFIGDRL